MKDLRLRPRAAADLDDIWLRVAADDIAAADALIDDFTEVKDVEKVAQHIAARHLKSL